MTTKNKEVDVCNNKEFIKNPVEYCEKLLKQFQAKEQECEELKKHIKILDGVISNKNNMLDGLLSEYQKELDSICKVALNKDKLYQEAYEEIQKLDRTVIDVIKQNTCLEAKLRVAERLNIHALNVLKDGTKALVQIERGE